MSITQDSLIRSLYLVVYMRFHPIHTVNIHTHKSSHSCTPNNILHTYQLHETHTRFNTHIHQINDIYTQVRFNTYVTWDDKYTSIWCKHTYQWFDTCQFYSHSQSLSCTFQPISTHWAVHFSQSALSELYISANQHYFSSQSWCPKFCRWHNLTQLTLDLGLQVSLVFWTIYNAIDKFHAMLSQGICCSMSWLVFALIQGESKARTRTGDQFKEFAEL